MTQAHSFLLRDFDFSQVHTLSLQSLPLSAQAHIKALRIREGELVEFMDGQGHFMKARCTSKQPYSFENIKITYHPQEIPLLHLYLSVPRKDALTQTLTQATEMGVQKFTFITSDHNDLSPKEFDKTIERARRVLESSVEQCRAPHLPTIHNTFMTLFQIPSDKILFFADENLSAQSLVGIKDSSNALDNIRKNRAEEWGLLVGPEGGWSDVERAQLSQRSHTLPLGLGSRILRVPTASVAALALLQNYRQRVARPKTL